MASPAMPATGAVVPPSDGSAGLGSQMPTNRQGRQPGMGNALRPQAAAPMAPMMTPQAQPPRQKSALLSGVASFAKGFDPDSFAQGEQQAQQTQAQEREKLMGMYQQALAWTDQALALGDDAAMNQFIAQNAEKIQQTTGQDMRPVLAQGVNRQQLMQERAALAAQLGQSPAQAEPMSAYEAAQIELKKNQPIIANAGQRGFQDTDGDGVLDEIFAVPANPAVPGSDPSGTLHSTQILEDGRILKTFRDGRQEVSDYKAQEQGRTVDIGGVPYEYRPRGGQINPITTPEIAGENAGTVEGGKVTGKAEAEGKIALPGAIANAQEALNVMRRLQQHPGFKKRYGLEGAPGSVGLMAPGGEGADAQSLINQIAGQAFLQAIQSMRGTGPISEREGLAATAAVTRLGNNMQSPAAAEQALKELMQRVENMTLLAKAKAGAPIDYSTLSDDQLEMLAAND